MAACRAANKENLGTGPRGGKRRGRQGGGVACECIAEEPEEEGGGGAVLPEAQLTAGLLGGAGWMGGMVSRWTVNE